MQAVLHTCRACTHYAAQACCAVQVRVFRSVMAKMPPTLLQRGPTLHALASEIAMWLVVHHRSDRSADVLTPLCSAILDCSAGEATAMRLEQPAALMDNHMCAPSGQATTAHTAAPIAHIVAPTAHTAAPTESGC